MEASQEKSLLTLRVQMKTAKQERLPNTKRMGIVFFLLSLISISLGFYPFIDFLKGQEACFFALSGIFFVMGIFVFRSI